MTCILFMALMRHTSVHVTASSFLADLGILEEPYLLPFLVYTITYAKPDNWSRLPISRDYLRSEGIKPLEYAPLPTDSKLPS